MKKKHRSFTDLVWLLKMLIIRELKSRYKSASLGFIWLFVNPIFQMLVFTVIFQIFVPVPTKNYWIFVLCGLFVWMFFSTSLTAATRSLVDNRNLINKVAFPRILLPVSAVLSNLPVLCFSLILLSVVSWLQGDLLPVHAGFALVSVILVVILTMSIGVILSTLEVTHRDVAYIVQSGLLILFYATPIVYPLNVVPDSMFRWMVLNPLVGIVITLQSFVAAQETNYHVFLTVSFLITTMMAIIGYLMFSKREPKLADWL